MVEDEPALAEAIRYGLEREGYVCEVAPDGRAALEAFSARPPDMILLDLMLPGISGVDVCRSVREVSAVPIIVVSARSDEVDKVIALELGADDYVTKPYGTRELVARVRSVLRRTSGASGAGAAKEKDDPSAPPREEETAIIVVPPVELDLDRHEVRVRGTQVILPPKELLLLECLLRRAGKLCTRGALILDVWGNDYYGDTRTLDVHIRRLRWKIEEDPHRPKHLCTVRGLGYKFEPEKVTQGLPESSR
ncbi:MAG: response regulator transcription factor [Actinomycetota bacterium]